MQGISVYVVDDHAIFRRGVAALVASEPALHWAGDAADGAQALREAPALAPDVVLVDLAMSGMEGVAVIAALKALLPRSRYVAVSCAPHAVDASRALAAGASCVALKSATPQDLAAMVQAAHSGRRAMSPAISAALAASERNPPPGGDLTRREFELLTLMAVGLSNQDIARRMDIGLPTVKFHVTHILSKLNVDNRTAAVLAALRHRIVALEPA